MNPPRMDYAICDSDGFAVNPHPDANGWNKACAECAFRLSDPQQIGVAYQRDIRQSPEGQAFYCIHREDGEYHRVCASFSAINKVKRIARP